MNTKIDNTEQEIFTTLQSLLLNQDQSALSTRRGRSFLSEQDGSLFLGIALLGVIIKLIYDNYAGTHEQHHTHHHGVEIIAGGATIAAALAHAAPNPSDVVAPIKIAQLLETGSIRSDDGSATYRSGNVYDGYNTTEVAGIFAQIQHHQQVVIDKIHADIAHITPSVTPILAPDLALTKLVDGLHTEIVTPGQEITYAIAVNNSGTGAAQNVVVNDFLPNGITVENEHDSTSASGLTYANGIWTIGNLAAGATDTLTIHATVNMSDNTTQTSFANAQSNTNLYGYNTLGDGGHSFDVNGVLQLNNAGNPLTTIAHDGDGVGITTVINAQDYSSSAYDQINYNGITNQTEALVVDLSQSSVQAQITLTHLISNENVEGEYGAVSAFDANHNYIGTVFFGPEQSGIPSFLVNPTMMPYAPQGAAFVAGTFSDSGTETINITDQMFGLHAFQYLAFTSLQYGAGVVQTSAWPNTPGQMDSSDYYLNSISASTDNGQILNTIVNTATVTNSNLIDSATVHVQEADLSISNVITGPLFNVTNVTLNTDFNFTITILNHGPNTANNVTITDLLPTGFNFVNATSTAGTYNSANGNWDISAIANGATDTLTLTAKETVLHSPITNTASITASSLYDAVTSNNSSSLAVTALAAGHGDATISNLVTMYKGSGPIVLNADGTLQGNYVVDPSPHNGDVAVYTVIATNYGPTNLSNATLVHDDPSQVSGLADIGWMKSTDTSMTTGALNAHVAIASGSDVVYYVAAAVNTTHTQVANTDTLTTPAGFTNDNPLSIGNVVSAKVTFDPPQTTHSVDHTSTGALHLSQLLHTSSATPANNHEEIFSHFDHHETHEVALLMSAAHHHVHHH